jgi:hypothetical protein|nr:MAG TPA: hypothetical protein [Caudoviricetes sp.]
MNKWWTYGLGGEFFTRQQVEQTAQALEDADLQEAATEWFECARQMRALEIIDKHMGTGGSLDLPTGLSLHL